jgi:hypothetical protein
MVVGDNKIDDSEKCRRITGNFDCHCNAAVQCDAHHSMKHIHGNTGSHWIPPQGECMCCIALVAVMVHDFVVKHTQNTKTQKHNF